MKFPLLVFPEVEWLTIFFYQTTFTKDISRRIRLRGVNNVKLKTEFLAH